jgi:hypothetical protein
MLSLRVSWHTSCWKKMAGHVEVAVFGGFESCSWYYLPQYWQSVSKLSLWRLSWAMSGVDCTTSMAYRGVLRCRECLVSSRRFRLIVDETRRQIIGGSKVTVNQSHRSQQARLR